MAQSLAGLGHRPGEPKWGECCTGSKLQGLEVMPTALAAGPPEGGPEQCSSVPCGCCRGLLGLLGQFSSSQSRSSQEPAASLSRIPDFCTNHIFIIPSSQAEKCRTTPHTYTHTRGCTHHCTHIQKPHRASLDSGCWEVTQEVSLHPAWGENQP